jgi:uncharacterized protein YjiS (DUF1127 family)
MISHSISQLFVNTLCGNRVFGRGQDRDVHDGDPPTLAVRRIGVVARLSDWIGHRWQRQPETLDMAMERLAHLSPHLLEDIGVREAPATRRRPTGAGKGPFVVVQPTERPEPRVTVRAPAIAAE